MRCYEKAFSILFTNLYLSFTSPKNTLQLVIALGFSYSNFPIGIITPDVIDFGYMNHEL